MVTLLAMTTLTTQCVSAQTSTGMSDDGTTGEIGELRQLLAYAEQKQLQIGGGLGGVILFTFIVTFVLYRKYRTAQQQLVQKDAWAQSQLHNKTTPMGATNPYAVLNVLVQTPPSAFSVV